MRLTALLLLFITPLLGQAQTPGEYDLDLAKWGPQWTEAGIQHVSLTMVRDYEVVARQDFGGTKARLQYLAEIGRFPATIAALRLVEAKKLSLDAPLSNFLKTVKPKIPATGTVRALLAGTVGFAPGTGDSLVYDPNGGQPMGSLVALQRVLEAAAKKPFPILIDSNVIEPLGLKQTDFLNDEDMPEILRMTSTVGDLGRMVSQVMGAAEGRNDFLSEANAKLFFGQKSLVFSRGTMASGYFANWTIRSGDTWLSIRSMPEDGIAAIMMATGTNDASPISSTLTAALKQVTTVPVGKSASPFEPYHVNGEYKDSVACPVCEYKLQPMVFAWAQNDTDENLIALARGMQPKISELGLPKLRGFVVLSNVVGDFGAAQKRATELSAKAQAPGVVFLVIKDPMDGTLAKYRIPRDSRNVVYFVRDRLVKSLLRDFSFDANEFATQLDALTR